GFRAEFKDLESLEHPGIVPIEYAGFKHFVVLREIRDGRVYVADPALGSISFTQARFEEVWDQNVVFIVYPGERPPVNALALSEQDLRLSMTGPPACWLSENFRCWPSSPRTRRPRWAPPASCWKPSTYAANK